MVRLDRRRPEIAARFRAHFRGAALVLSLMALSAMAGGCKDSAKESAGLAEEHASWLAALATKDVAELEHGMPEGSTKLEALWANGADPKADVQIVQKALLRTRREVRDLTVAKSTFFALADEKGVALRNDLEQDVMAGQNLAMAFPALTAVAGGAPQAKTIGVFAGVTNDRDWIYAVPVKPGGAVRGLYVTGWSYRAFARHLKQALELEIKDRMTKGVEKGKTPLLYVMVVDETGAYGAPLTPPMNEQAVAALGLPAKLAAGPVRDVVELDGRRFGVGATSLPALAPGVGVAVLRSEL